MDICFGCGLENPHGLQIVHSDGPGDESSAVITIPWFYAGEPGVVHGGIQAVILDEVLGFAAQQYVQRRVGERRTIVTASFELKYKKPCPTDQPLVASARVERAVWPSVHVEGEISDSKGELLTSATARWRALEPET